MQRETVYGTPIQQIQTKGAPRKELSNQKTLRKVSANQGVLYQKTLLYLHSALKEKLRRVRTGIPDACATITCHPDFLYHIKEYARRQGLPIIYSRARDICWKRSLFFCYCCIQMGGNYQNDIFSISQSLHALSVAKQKLA